MSDVPADDVVRRLAAAIDEDIDDVPADLLAFAHRAGEWMVVDGELAALDEASPAAVRALPDDQRTAAFTAPPYSISVTLRSGTLVGELSPPPHPDVAVETPRSTREVAVDEHGRFRLGDVAPPFRLRLRADDLRIVTPWVTA